MDTGALWAVLEETIERYIKVHSGYDAELKSIQRDLERGIDGLQGMMEEFSTDAAGLISDFWYAFKDVVPQSQRDQDSYNNVRAAVYSLIMALR